MRKRRIRPHAARIGSLVAIKYLLMILCCRHWTHRLAINECQNRHFLSLQEFLDDDLTARIAKHFIHHNALQSFISFLTGKRYGYPFTSRQAICLNYNWKRLII
ncbi:hypothetical protein D3C78_1407310 [compost metagenome]